MILRGWQIEGFGCFQNASLLPESGLCSGLNFILGPNEAGKSTLLDFLRYTLHGYPDRRRALPRREPLRGGSHGGVLFYEVANEGFRLHRSGAGRNALHLSDADDHPHPEQTLQAHLGNVSGKDFCNIFAFSLRELQEERQFESDEIQNLLFTAAMGRTARQVSGIQSWLQSTSDRLFRPNARAGSSNPPLLMDLHSKLQQVRASLARARTEVEQSMIARLELKEISLRELPQLEKEQRALSARIVLCERLLKGWEPWLRHRRAQAALRDLGDLSRFPPQGSEAWRNWLHREVELQRSCQEQDLVVEELEKRLARFPEQFPLLALGAEIQQLHSQLPGHISTMEMLKRSREELVRVRDAWAEMQNRLGPAWQPAVIESFNPDLLETDQIRRQAACLKGLQEELARIRAERTRCGEVLEEKHRNQTMLAQTARQLQSSLPPNAGNELHEQRSLLARLDDAMSERQDRLNHIRELEDACFRSQSQHASTSTASWAISAGVLGVSALLTWPVLHWQTEVTWTFAFLPLGVTLVVASLATLWQRSKQIRTSRETMAGLKNRFNQSRNSLEAFDQSWRRQAADLEMDWPTTPSRREHFRDLHRNWERSLDELDRLSNQRDRIDSEVLNAQARAVELEESQRNIESKMQEELAKWRDSLRERGLPQELTLETVLDVLAILGGARRTLADLKRHEESVRREASRARRFLESLDFLFQKAGWDTCSLPATNHDLSGAQSMAWCSRFEQLLEGFHSEQALHRDRVDTDHELASATAKSRVLHEKITAFEKEKSDWMRSCGVVSAAEFEDVLVRVQRAESLQLEISRENHALSAIFGETWPVSELAAAAEHGHDWEGALESLQQQRAELCARRDQLIQRRTQLEQRIRQEETSSEIALLELEENRLDQQIREAVEEWAELNLALRLLAQTRARFEDRHQSPALVKAGDLLSKITKGTYSRILARGETTQLSLIDHLRRPRTVSELSRGTLEQLYLSIRLGYILHLREKQSIELPLLMDDVAVNFDPHRARDTLSILGECAEQGQQILFFTCHPTLTDMAPQSARKIYLDDYQFHSFEKG